MPAADIICERYLHEVRRRQTATATYASLTDTTRADISTVAHALAERPDTSLVISGVVGSGKTTLLRALVAADRETADSRTQPITLVTARQAAAAATDDSLRRQLERTPRLAIDDLGTEPAEVLVYGNAVRPVAELIETRYDNALPVYLTTNLNETQLRDRYGLRVYDRLVETAAFVIFHSPSHR